MSYVVKVSLDGFDVDTATPEQCAIHSDYPPIKAKTDQTSPHFATLSVNLTATVVQGVTHTLYLFDHEYDYVPFVVSNVEFFDGVSTYNGLGRVVIGATLDIKAFADATNFQVTLYDNFNWTNASSTLKVSYYIFAENGT